MSPMRLVVVSIVGLLLAACEVSPEQRARDVCTAACDCVETTPSKVELCVTMCIAQAPAMIPDACLDCVYQYSQSCTNLFQQCFAQDMACDEPQQP
jgi:hypothetical protein